jgi:hypothetical protein
VYSAISLKKISYYYYYYYYYYYSTRAGVRKGPAGQLPEGKIYQGRYDVSGIIGSMVPVNTGSDTRKKFSEN